MENMRAKLKKQGGFTLIEMLIVVAIIAILVAISIPVVNSSLEKARHATDEANERAAKTLALMLYMGAVDPMDYANLPGSDGTEPSYVPGSKIEAFSSDGLNYSGIFYDAKAGILTRERPEAYGQCTCGEIDANGLNHTGKVILIQVSEDGVFTPLWTPSALEEEVV